MNKLTILGFVACAVLFGSLSGIAYTTAQTAPTDKIFRKDFCASENTLLSDVLYPDLSELSYDSSGCPESVKVIHRWNELSISSKNTITSRLTLNGYVEGEEINTMTQEVVSK